MYGTNWIDIVRAESELRGRIGAYVKFMSRAAQKAIFLLGHSSRIVRCREGVYGSCACELVRLVRQSDE